MTRTRHGYPKYVTYREGRASPYLARVEGGRSKFFSTLEEALAFRDAEMARLGRAASVDVQPDSEPTRSRLKDDLAAWFERRRPDLTVNGAMSMQEAIDLTIIPKIGMIPTMELTHEKVREVIDQLRRTPTYKGTPLKEKSIVNRLSPLQSFYDELYSEGKVSVNPVKSAIAFVRRQWKSSSKAEADRATRAKFLTAAEARKLLEVSAEYGSSRTSKMGSWAQGELYFPIGFLVSTGIRAGEVGALNWGDIVWVDPLGGRLETPVVRISKTLLRATDSEGRHIVQPQTKGGTDREVALNSQCVLLVEQWKIEARRLGYGLGDADPIFPIARKYSGFKSMFRRCAERAGLPKSKHGVHSTRHAFATLLRATGASVPEIQKLLGHQDASTTQRYMDLAGINAADTTEALASHLPVGKVRSDLAEQVAKTRSTVDLETCDLQGASTGLGDSRVEVGGQVINFRDGVRKLRRVSR